MRADMTRELTARLTIRVTPAERNKIAREAKRAGLSISAYCRDKLPLAKAKSTTR